MNNLVLTTEQITKINDLFVTSQLLRDIDLNYMLEGQSIDNADDIENLIDDNGGFEVDVIYYSNAMKFLSENDASLKDSLTLAHDLGYSMQHINSETLASLLASQMIRNEFEGIKSELNDLIETMINEVEVNN
jgi:hypothetical protein